MKHFKLFFALFAMLALGVGNAWGEEVTYVFTSKDWAAKIGSTAANWTSNKAGAGFSNNGIQVTTATTGANGTSPISYNNISQIVVTYNTNKSKGNGTLSVKIGDNAVTTNNWQYSGSANGTSANFTSTFDYSSPQSGKVTLTANTTTNSIYVVSIKIVTSAGTEPPTPTTQYTIKWHTAKGVTTDVTLNEGATITKPATDPAMTGYEFMGWTEDCAVASDGTGFTAISNFGTATEDKDYYAVFAVETTTGGGGSTTGSKTLVSHSGSSYYTDGAITGVTGTNSASWTADAFTMVQNKNSGTAVSLTYDEIRVYASHSIVFTPSTGSTITSIVATATTTGYATALGGSSINNCTKSVSSSTVTITPTDGTKAITITNSAQSRLKTIVVNYTTSGGGTTTYDNYITTCASGIEYVELGDAFKWSATEAEVTIDATDNEFPTLTNTHNVPVTYSSSDDAIASISSDGSTVTLNKEGTVTITAKYAGGTSAGDGKEYKAKTVTYSLKVNKAAPVASGTTYVKVTSTAGITDGKYLIVYEDAASETPAPVAFDGALATLDAAKNTVAVEISNSTIAGNTDIDAALFTIDVTAGTLKSASGKYIGVSSNNNGLKTEDVAKDYKNAFSVDNNGNAVIAADFEGSTMSLRYNNTEGDNNLRFRYYKNAGQQPIALYKKASSHTLTYGTCTNGSVSADVADRATVLSGTTITLSNTPETNYKLATYDVYKTGDATTKVTVTDGKFVMPEFDVTISASFEPAKTLTSIVITTAATQTTFWQGETFNHTGLEVTAHFDGAADEVVTPTVTGSTATAGTQTVTVSFTEGTVTKTATYSIEVKAIPNTQETAYTVAEAYDIIDKLTIAEGVFIKGIVSQVDEYLTTYKSITYWISADGTTTNQLKVYSGKGLESAEFNAVTDLTVGDQVIVCGNLKKYNETYEFDKNNYLAEHTKTTKDPAGLAYATISYTANVGEAFTTPELTNPHKLVVTYSTSDASKATVDANSGAVTIVAAGEVTITASTTGDATHDAGSASYTITITDLSLLIATLPFEFNGKQADIEGTPGMTQSGIDSKDYADAPYLKMNTTGDWLIIRFDSEPGKLSYDIKNNTFSEGTFSVQESADGETYTNVAVHTEITETQSEEHTLLSTSRYVKFIYTEKVNGNVGLGNIKITKPDNRAEANLSWTPTSVTLTQGDVFTAPTLSYPNSITGITYETSDDQVATVTSDGVIALAGATGSATITATFAGDENYKPATATCTITVLEYIETLDGEWQLVTDASKLQIGMEIIIASVADAGAVKTMGEQGNNNRRAVASTVDGDKLNPAVGTTVITLEDCQLYEGLFALKTKDGYLYAAGSSSNHLKSQEGINNNACWTITVTEEGVASVVATNSSNRNVMRYNPQDKLFSCYDANNNQKDIAIYAKVPDCTRQVPAGYYATVCLPGNIVKVLGATLYEVAGKDKDGKRIVFDEVLTPEAGMPYIFLAHNAEVLFYCGDQTAAAGNHKSLYGTFTELKDGDLTEMYMVQGNKIVKCKETGCKIPANRAYFKGSELDVLGKPGAQMPGRRRITMGAESENETTGTEEIITPNIPVSKKIVDGQLIIIRDGEMYNAQGQRL